MATGTGSNFTILNEEYHSGQVEGLAQNLNALNSGSKGCILLRTETLKGDYETSTFFARTSNIITRRDATSTSAVTDKSFTQAQNRAVKMKKKIGPIGHTLDSWRAIGSTPEKQSYVLGQHVGTDKVENFIATACLALKTAIGTRSTMVHDQSAATMTHAILNGGIRKMGDMASRIGCLVMHSKPFFDLVAQTLTDKITNVADTVIYGGSPGTFGKPVVVTDCSSLVIDNGSAADTYATLALVPGACLIKETEAEIIESQLVLGGENIIGRAQGEYAYNIECKGYAYQTAGGVNPTDATIGTASSWSKVVTLDKDTAGVLIKTL